MWVSKAAILGAIISGVSISCYCAFGESTPSSGRQQKLPVHWAFQPILRPQIPRVNDTKRLRSTVDSYILSALEGRGLMLAPPLNRRRLIRRVYFDVMGFMMQLGLVPPPAAPAKK